MKHSKKTHTDISMEIPTLSKQTTKRLEKKEKANNAAPQVKPTSFTVMIISSLVTSLSIVAVTVVSAKIWRPKLLPELKKIENLEKDIIVLNKEILSLQGYTKNKDLLSREVDSLKKEINKTKTDIKVEIAEVNDKINTVVSEQKNSEALQETKQTLEENELEKSQPPISMDAGIFYAQFLTAIEENKPLLQYYEHAGKLDLSDKFKDIIADIKKINFEKIKSDEELADDFNQIHNDIVQDTMITKNAKKGQKNLIDNIKDKIQITSNNQPNRAQLKSDFIMAKRLLDKDDFEGAIDMLTPYASHKNVGLWVKHTQDRIDHDDAIQNVRNFKGPYSK